MDANRQRGIAADLVIYGIAALAVVVPLAWGLFKYQHAMADVERLTTANNTLRGNVDTLTRTNQDQLAENLMQRQRQEHTNTLLAKLQAQRTARDETERKIDATLEALSRRKPEVRAWLDTPVPADVMLSLRLDTATGGTGGKDDSRKTASGVAATGGNP